VEGTITANPVLLRHREWVERNPLYLWRHTGPSKVSRMEAAGILGVSTYAVSAWENGASRPNEESMDRLSGLLGYPARSAWNAWEEQRV
jgi:hypothetical protein